jgi:hypothetical protein
MVMPLTQSQIGGWGLGDGAARMAPATPKCRDANCDAVKRAACVASSSRPHSSLSQRWQEERSSQRSISAAATPPPFCTRVNLVSKVYSSP